MTIKQLPRSSSQYFNYTEITRSVLWLSEWSMLALGYTNFLPEYEFNETPHLVTTPSKTQMDARVHVCIMIALK